MAKKDLEEKLSVIQLELTIIILLVKDGLVTEKTKKRLFNLMDLVDDLIIN